MFFHHLKNFSPYSGHIYNELRASIVRKNGNLVSKSDDRFGIMERIGYFPFKELRRDGQAYFISDLELFDFFQTTEDTLKNYDIDYYPDWNFEAKERLLQIFLDGYQLGKADFRGNIGISYGALSHIHKLEYLHNFCLFCLDFLYFDGELDNNLFYNLGYIQASLYLGFIEINNLKALSDEENRANINGLSRNDPPQERKSVLPTYTEIEDEPKRIEIYCDVTEIKNIWLVLTAPINTTKGIQQPVFSEEELEKYLGSMFHSGAFPDAFKPCAGLSPKTTSRGDMRNVLIALMYSCYCLNRNFYRGSNQIIYVAMLKRYFSVFGTSEIESTKSVMSTYALKGLEVLGNSLDKNPHIEEMQRILKFHSLLH